MLKNMQNTIAIENIFSEIYGKLFGYISKHVKNKNDVNDIIQDTFIKVKTNIESLKNPAKADKWIFQIARNTMNDYFRKQKRYFENEDNYQEIYINENVFEDEDIKSKIRIQNFSEYAGFIVSELPEKYRKAVYMKYIRGFSMKELAEELDISVSGAKSRVQRGRKMIKEIILKCCQVSTDKYGNIVDYKPNICKPKKKC